MLISTARRLICNFAVNRNGHRSPTISSNPSEEREEQKIPEKQGNSNEGVQVTCEAAAAG